MKKLIILDRDGVINYDSKDYIKSPAEWHPYHDSLTAIKKLTAHNWTVVIATNQSGIARKLYNESTLADIHLKMNQQVQAAGGKIDGIYYCPHLPDDDCQCRKPKPGLLEQIQRDYDVSLANVPFVGDSWRDLEAGLTAGCEPILVRTGNGLTTEAKYPRELANIKIFDDLLAATTQYFI